MRRTLSLVLTIAGLALAAALPAGAQGTSIDSIHLSPAEAGPNDHVHATVRLTGPAPDGGAYVQLSSTGSIWIPGTVVVPAGQTTATFVVSVNSSARSGQAKVTGTLSGVSATSNVMQTDADPALARQLEQDREAAQAAASYPTSAASYNAGYGYGYPYPYYYPYVPGPIYPSGPTVPAPTYNPVLSVQGMGGIPASGRIDMGDNVPHIGR